MAGEYDSGMKRLVKINPADYVSWLVQDAIYLEEYNPHLPNRSIDADSLLKAAYKAVPDRPFLVHIEFQTKPDLEMARRLWEYNVSATIKYGLPTKSFVIYLKKISQVATAPYQVKIPDGEEIHRFHFGVIKLWEIATEELRQTGLTGLLALLPLTENGAKREVVETMIDDLQSEIEGETQRDMLSIGLTFATLVFNKKDQDWLMRRISMLEDILEESPFYQQIMHRGEEKGRVQGLEKMRETALGIVQARFPKLARLAKKQVAAVNNLGILSELIVNLSLAKDEVEAKKKLLKLVEDEES